jgi:RHS repeat-associated protein
VSGKRRWFASVRYRLWGGTLTAATALAAALALVTPAAVAQGVVTGSPDFSGDVSASGHAGPYHFKGKVWNPKPLPATPVVGSHPLRPSTVVHPRGDKALGSYRAAVPAWPRSGASTVSLIPTATPVKRPVKAGILPVWVAPASASGDTKAQTAALPTAIRVQVASHAQTVRAGFDGMLLGLTRTDTGSRGGAVQVVIDYSSVAKAYGGGFGSRLQLVRVPACALTTPQAATCRTRTPVAFTNRAGADQLTATVSLGSSPGATPLPAHAAPTQTTTASATTTLAVTSGASGSQGNYTATSLNPSGSWQTSGTGAFTYSYPVDVPAAIGGNAPSVALDYDSQSEDGETSARNSQASWIGDGWNYQPGFIERPYRGCGTLLDGSGNKILKGSGDLCWGGDNAVMSFGPYSGQLVPTASSGVPGEVKEWRLRNDDGTVVQELSGAANGLYNGIYFRVLSTDGSAAYFGADHSPTGPGTSGLATGAADSSTDSAWGVPVLHPQSGDPCYDAAKGKASRCDQPEGWRWNLDFVVSPNGFVQRYDYSKETNYYDLGGGQAATGDSGALTSYTRGGTLDAISYGYTLDDEQAGRKPAAQVVFTSQQRCQTTSTFTDCSAAGLNDSTAPHWPDVPWDLHCDSTDSTTLPPGSTTVPAGVCVTAGPTFWSTTRLDSITTKVHVKDATTDSLVAVDSYQLGQVYSDAGGTVDPVTGTTVDPVDAGSLQAVMWLQSIRHTGKDTYGNGNSDISQNQVSFTGTEIDNRVNDTSPSAPPLYRPRISSVQTETGGSIAVDYNLNPCAGKSLSVGAADSNTNSCYPVYWTVPGASKPIADWFNKTTVHTVTASDLTIAAQYTPDSQKIPAGSETQVSTYSYAGAAWHRDDSALTDDQYRTWDQFRGFRTVTVQTGKAPEPVTQQTTTYLQGMDGDYKAGGTRRSVSVDAKVGGTTVETVTDADNLAGTALETDSYSAAGGSINAETVRGPFTFSTTASVAQSPWTDWTQADNPGQSQPALSTLPDLTAQRIRTAQSHGYALLADGTWRHTRTDTTYDSQGRVSSVDAHGDVAVPAQEKCSTTAYALPSATNTMALSYPDQVTTVSGPCGTAASAATLLTDKKIYYDGNGSLSNLGTFGQLDQSGSSAVGEPTAVQIATGFSGSTETWQTTTAMTYDGAGRVTDSLDTTGQDTHTDYLPKWTSGAGTTNPTSIETLNPQLWKVTSTLDPLRGLSTRNVDANNRETDITYDALGRRTAVWLPGRDKAAGQSADTTFAYSVNPGAVAAPGGTITQPGDPSTVTTKTLRDDGTYSTSVTIYDGLLQPRQTQSTAMGDSASGRVITDTFYDSHGWPTISYAPYADPVNSPSSTLYAANENDIPSETTTEYNGQGRPVTSTLWHQAIQQWHTSTRYPGADETDTTAPVGGRSTATFTNALGQTTRTVVENTGSTVTLQGGAVIPSGTSLTSDSVRLTMQADGNLVLSALATGKTIWSSGTSGNPGAYAQFGTDGNLVVRTTAGVSAWTTGLPAVTGASLQVRNDSTADVVSSTGAVLWHQGTAGTVAPADAATSYTYFPAGQVASVKDSAGNTWSYNYNLLGQETSQTDPNAGASTFDKYDAVGNLLQATDSRGQVLSYSYDWDNRLTAEYSGPWSATPDPAKELTSRVYDTLAKGYPTSSTRYVGGASGKAYTEAVTGYNTAYQPLGTTVTVPVADGFAPPAGQTAQNNSVTYTRGAFYTPAVGLLSTLHYQADGGLPAEDVDYGYEQNGNLDGIGGYINAAETPAYVDTTVHDPFGRVLQANYGPTGKELANVSQYDLTTGRVTQTSSLLQTTGTAADVVNYRYDQAGQITAIDDLQNNATHDTQCFAYDSVQRLTAAWTDTAGITDPTSAMPGAVGGCTTPSVQTTTTAPVKTTTVGGPAAYWQTYTYDLLGDRTGMVNHDTTGNALNDTTQSITFTGADGTTTASTPDQGSVATTSNPTLGTATLTGTHLDPAYNNKNAGNTMSRILTTTGPVRTGFTLSGGGKLCIDDSRSSTTPGGKIQIYTCNGGANQSWTVGTDGTVKVLGMCLDTNGNATAAGTLVVIDTCSTDATQKWRATAAGTLVNNANPAVCLTDPGAVATLGTQLTVATCGSSGQTWTTAGTGALAPGQTQTLTYDAEGRTATVTTPSGTTSTTSKYLYDADGNLLEQTSATGSTDKTRILYLFGGAEQITLNVAAGTSTGLRNYVGPDGTTITRSSSGSVTYQVANAQGTATTAIGADSLAVTRRSFAPYGNPRGTTPSSWVAPDENRGFLGQPTDATTGLDLLGARDYDPAQGRFLTPDPLFEAGDPNQMGGYTYAADNPTSASDPSGLALAGGDGTGDGPCGDNCYPDPPATPTPAPTDSSSGGTGGNGGNGTVAHPGQQQEEDLTDYGPDADAILNTFLEEHAQPPDGPTLFDKFVGQALDQLGFTDLAQCASGIGLSNLEGCANAALKMGQLVGGRGSEHAGEEPVPGESLDEPGDASPAVRGSATAKGVETGESGTVNAARAAKNAAEDALRDPVSPEETQPSDPAAGTRQAKSGGGCSFSPDTPVLLDDGKSKPIGQIKTGDKVESADPATGKEEGGRSVQHVWINHDHDLLDVTVTTGPGHTSTIHTTANHPFWDESTHTWVPAGNLHPGHHLASTNGNHPVVLTIKPAPGTANRWNLTVQQLHTYYVVAGGTSVLVHNTNTGCPTSYALSLKTGAPKGGGANQAYQVRAVGSTEYHATGGGTQVWADGLDFNTSELLDAKYVGNAGRSPFVPGGKVPDFIQAKIDAKMNDEFSRYAAVINDPGNPLVGLRVITNEPGAVPYFTDLMQQRGIPGSVVVDP